jgi:5'-3' exonuclease
MGIRYLNRFLMKHCITSRQKHAFSTLQGKTICIDILNYMYKYATDNKLLPQIKELLDLFRMYCIVPIFVFDGKAPIEKRDLLQKRREERWEAKQKWQQLQECFDSSIDEDTRSALEEEIAQWKRKAVQINAKDIAVVKELIESYDYQIINAVGEADEECALMVKRGKAWACMSEDMDLIVYGCDRVVRNVQLSNASLSLYLMKDILCNLGLTQKELREICVLSGTDYNISSTTNATQFNLLHTVKLYKKYKYNMTVCYSKDKLEFYHWLKKKTQCDINIPLLQQINTIFDIV